MNLGGILGDLTFTNIVGGLLFSSIGYAAFMIGKRTMNTHLMLLGGALMLYCLFITQTVWLYVIGTALTVAAYLARNDA